MLMTRPRSSSGTVSCTSELVSEAIIRKAMPPRNSSRKLAPPTGSRANAATMAPKTIWAPSSTRPMWSKRPSQATTSAPTTAPAPKVVIMRLSSRTSSAAKTGRKALSGRASDVVAKASAVSPSRARLRRT